ncbi:MAG: hypothetical protein IJU98_04570 [Synergistaceae bacterium]|nr:hypothetical protein [Synergistaceae bacterium]
MFAVKGVIQGNTVLMDDAEVTKYDGHDAIVTILDAASYKNVGIVPARKPGIAKGKFICPDNIDEDNERISQWFEGNL